MILFERFAKEMIPLIDKTLQELIDPIESEELRRASLYALEGGKRLRPLLTLAAVASFCPQSLKKAYLPAVCLEMVHTYSLIHDDLPCMDNDDFRRGRQSLHKAFPEWLALLTGDFLLTHALQSLSADANLSCEEKTDLLFCLSSRSGGEGMIAGQVDDLMFQGKKVPLGKLKKMQEKKTAYLFMAAMEFGAILCHIPLHQKKSLISFGEKIGLAYQIIDDISDSVQENGSDQILEKASLISQLGKKEAKQMAIDLLIDAKDLLLAGQKADLLLSFLGSLENSF